MAKRFARWSPDELSVLREHYSNIKTLKLSEALPGRTPRSVYSAAFRLKMMKSEPRLREMGRENAQRRPRIVSGEVSPPAGPAAA